MDKQSNLGPDPMSTVYDLGHKKRVAEWFGLPSNTYYEYSYYDWTIAAHRWSKFTEIMYETYAAVGTFAHKDTWRLPFAEWKDDFIAWADAHGVQYPGPYLREEK